MLSPTVQMIGLCRFSYAAEVSAFNTGCSSLESLKAILYDRQRLERRLAIFETISLPAIRAQTDQDFTLAVLVGEGLPNWCKERLHASLSDIPQVHIIEETEGQLHKSVCSTVLHRLRRSSGAYVGEFRLDDDDAVAIDFIERARHDFEGSEKRCESYGMVELDYCSGILLEVACGPVKIHKITIGHWTPAQVMFLPTSSDRSIIDYRHTKAWRKHPSISIPSPVMFIRTSHETNDSDMKNRTFERHFDDVAPDRLARLVRKRFQIDLNRMLGLTGKSETR